MRTGGIDANEVQAESQEAPDPSERFLAYFSHATMTEKTLPLFGAASQAGEGTPAIDDAYPLNAGGYPIDAVSSILASGGLSLETTTPYRNDEGDVVSWTDSLTGLNSCYSREGTRSLGEDVRTGPRRHRRVMHGAVRPLEFAADERRRGVAGASAPESIDDARRKATRV
ncbi:hypothetical protein DMP07_03000 [Slackia faecicanis]|uniref:Uncharacterized protein n=2 Tax=Slackia faecicanis TaxID=255723 RepID=A0A3N0AFJ3_9ACTN|nr:hypothetical protein DMP07_03000 [Slackia faecicanis]